MKFLILFLILSVTNVQAQVLDKEEVESLNILSKKIHNQKQELLAELVLPLKKSLEEKISGSETYLEMSNGDTAIYDLRNKIMNLDKDNQQVRDQAASRYNQIKSLVDLLKEEKLKSEGLKNKLCVKINSVFNTNRSKHFA